MNFFGHAVVASWRTSEPGFVLGAMLPDFATMSRNRIASVGEPLDPGVAHHHQVDAVFHQASTFVQLCELISMRLENLDVRRGTARAVGHIGTELLLDGWLRSESVAQGRGVEVLYAAALDVGAADRLGSQVQWRDSNGAGRFESLRQRLVSYGLPPDFASPETVAHRIARAVEHRPRLRVDSRDTDAVLRTLQEMQKVVENAASALMDEVKRGLQD